MRNLFGWPIISGLWPYLTPYVGGPNWSSHIYILNGTNELQQFSCTLQCTTIYHADPILFIDTIRFYQERGGLHPSPQIYDSASSVLKICFCREDFLSKSEF